MNAQGNTNERGLQITVHKSREVEFGKDRTDLQRFNG